MNKELIKKLKRADYVHATALFSIENLQAIAARLASTRNQEEGSIPPGAIDQIRTARRRLNQAITELQLAEEDIQKMKDAIERQENET